MINLINTVPHAKSVQQMQSSSDREDHLFQERARIRRIREREEPSVREQRLEGERARVTLRRVQEEREQQFIFTFFWLSFIIIVLLLFNS